MLIEILKKPHGTLSMFVLNKLEGPWWDVGHVCCSTHQQNFEGMLMRNAEMVGSDQNKTDEFCVKMFEYQEF